MFINYFKGLYRDRYILFSLVNRDLKNKYRNSKLGIAWSVITPLGLVLIIGSVYSIIFGADPKIFIPTLFAGLTPWLFISSAADGGTGALLSAEGYLKQTTVNSQIFPVRTTMVNFMNFIYSVIAYYIVYFFLQPQNFGVEMLMVIPGLCLLFLFALSWANFSSLITLIIRDYQPLQSLILQGLFYATPIIFPAELIKEKGYAFVYLINPIYYIIEVIRAPLLGINVVETSVLITATIITVVVFVCSVFFQMKMKKNIIFKL